MRIPIFLTENVTHELTKLPHLIYIYWSYVPLIEKITPLTLYINAKCKPLIPTKAFEPDSKIQTDPVNTASCLPF